MKYFKLLGIMSLLVFSFYLTDFVTELAISSNPLMQSIKANSSSFYLKSVDAIIENNTIIPGIKGKKVNEMESFLNMKDFGSFNSNYLIYDYFSPNVSINDNKEKIIISGNKQIRQISFLIYNNKQILNYLNENKIKYSKMININDSFDYKENINIESDASSFDDLDTLLNKNDLNKKICILNYSNIDKCRKKSYFIVNPSIVLKNSNYNNYIKEIDNGSIILIDDNLNLNNFILLLKKINSLDLKIVYLSEIIVE